MRASRRLSRWLTAGLGVVLVAVGVATADAKQKVNSFAGSCSVQGTDTFTPPATNTVQSLDVTYDASGTCSGTLNGRTISSAPVELHQTAHNVNGSCSQAQTTEPGTGALVFADGTSIAYRFEFTSFLTEVDFTMQGQRSGTAKAHATFVTARTTQDVVLQCAGGGAAKVPMDMSLTSDSPLVSAR